MTLDEMLEELEDREMEVRERDIFPYDDDVGYYDYFTDDGINSKDADCPEAFDSCWDKY